MPRHLDVLRRFCVCPSVGEIREINLSDVVTYSAAIVTKLTTKVVGTAVKFLSMSRPIKHVELSRTLPQRYPKQIASLISAEYTTACRMN
jgi:hypothetical protein